VNTLVDMAEVTIYHNQNCSTSRHALDVATEEGVDVDVVKYLSTPPDADTLRAIIDKLEDPVTDLVRRDQNFAAAGLTDDDVATVDQVVDVLVANPKLMQRPVIVTSDTALIGRPKDRADEFLRSLAR
jgi:arsenate reductase